MEEIVNRVANSSLVSIDIDQYLDQSERAFFDLKDALFQGMILREKDFRLFVREFDWSQYSGKNVIVYCSVEAIIPAWAYMLIATKLEEHVNMVAMGDEDALENKIVDQAIAQIMRQDLKDAKVVIKGCGSLKNRDYAYFELTRQLMPVVSSIMYGEPCSTVPVFKKRKGN